MRAEPVLKQVPLSYKISPEELNLLKRVISLSGG